MELISVLRLLWRRRLLVVLGAVLAGAAAYVLGPAPTPPRGYAITRVVLDTSQSQLAGDAPFGAETLPWRATLAAQLLGTDANRRSISAATGIRPEGLEVTDLELTTPTIPASLPRAAAEGAYGSGVAKPYTLDLHTDGIVPLITLSAGAPDREAAVRLAQAAVSTLEAYTSAPANTERLALQVRTTSPIDSVMIPGGRGRKKMAAIAFILGCMWIVGLAIGPMALRGLRSAVRDPEPVR